MTYTHDFPPIYSPDSIILVLGSFPSAASREARFYYANPRNRFWPLMEQMLKWRHCETDEQKTAMLLANGVALWDCAASCEVCGSSDTSIKNVVPNNVAQIIASCSIQSVFANGQTAKQLYDRLILPDSKLRAVRLPSTSPANAAFSMARLEGEWREILPFLGKE